MSDDEREDPFADLETGDDREGDPFERLDDEGDAETGEPESDLDDVFDGPRSTPNEGVADVFEGSGTDEDDADNAFEQAGADTDRSTGGAGDDAADTTADTSTTVEDNPFDGPEQFDRTASADTAATREGVTDQSGTTASGSPADEPGPASSDDPFAGMDDRDGDPFEGGESAFERVDVGGVDAESVWEGLTAEDDDPTDTSADEVPDVGYVEVSKHRYCEQCEFFSGPPEVSCSNEDAQIIEFVDMETVRLADCPVVAEQRALENEE
ncbi:hypothetical protein [Haloarcula pelagica]|uniref:hypothetical protein n=1 Tax=Haloarcula pelagica TaxID=3033389 RepID=UPI0024C226C5|nr:hypothetical protein [Halomicroarcula sp. YJ-61-S]